MSSILPFVVVALATVVVVVVALDAAAQPATESDRVRRDPWRERLAPAVHWCARSARDVRTWLLAGMGALRRRWRARRARRASARADRRAQRAADQARKAREAPPVSRAEAAPVSAGRTEGPIIVAEPPKPDGVVTTALRVKPDVATAEAVGDEVSPKGPGFFVRVRSALGLMVLIAMLGLVLAAGLGAAAAAIGAAIDSFVN